MLSHDELFLLENITYNHCKIFYVEIDHIHTHTYKQEFDWYNIDLCVIYGRRRKKKSKEMKTEKRSQAFFIRHVRLTVSLYKL